MRAAAETEEEVVAAEVCNVGMAGEAVAQGVEVDGTVVFVDLDGVSSQRVMWARSGRDVSEDALAADLAVGAGGVGGDFGVVQIAIAFGLPVADGVPEVEGEEGAAHEMRLAGEELEGFGDLDGGGEVDGGGEDSRGVACFDVAGGGLGEDAGETGGLGKRQMRGSLHCGGKCASSGRDDGLLGGRMFMVAA